jgi:hypothetical protein
MYKFACNWTVLKGESSSRRVKRYLAANSQGYGDASCTCVQCFAQQGDSLAFTIAWIVSHLFQFLDKLYDIAVEVDIGEVLPNNNVLLQMRPCQGQYT